MAGRFIKTSSMKSEMPNLLADTTKQLLNNPYYLYNSASVSKATYYNLNTTMTTLDEATRSNYAELSPESPLRFNKINGMCLYGINKIEPALEFDDFGLRGSDIQGDAIILPKTIIPYPGDMFTLDQIGSNYIFKVTKVDPNTLDTGAVMYRINYTLSSSDGVEHIEPQVVKEFNFYIENYGSNFGCLISAATASEVSDIERYTVMLKDYYISLFYNAKIQSFSYLRQGTIHVYDPFLIEFLIRNKILDGATNYIYVSQQIYLPRSFPIDYDRTFFSSLEEKDVNKHYCITCGNLELCRQKLSLLYAHPQDYYVMQYDRVNPNFHIIDIFNDPSFMEKVRNNTPTDNNVLKNIIISYFNDEGITSEHLSQLKHVDYMSNPDLYYLIPMVIFCMEQYITSVMSNATSTDTTNTDSSTT